MTEGLCPACTSGPLNIEGHSTLWVQTIGSALSTFKCAQCQTLWKRTGANGQYVWENVGDRLARTPGMGVVLPPRSSAGSAPLDVLAKFRLPAKG